MDIACSTQGKNKKCIQYLVPNASREETVWVFGIWMNVMIF